MRSTTAQDHEAFFPLVADPTAFPGWNLGWLVASCPRESATQAQRAVEVSRTQYLVFDISRTRCRYH